jgi:hypothetical protein
MRAIWLEEWTDLLQNLRPQIAAVDVLLDKECRVQDLLRLFLAAQ